MNVFAGLVLGFICTLGGFFGAWKFYDQPRGQVLAQRVEASVIPTSSPSHIPTSSPTPVQSISPSPSVSASPTPSSSSQPPQVLSVATPSLTPKPTKTAAPTPSPTLQMRMTATPTPSLAPTPFTPPGPTPDVWSPPNMDPLFTKYANDYAVDKNALERVANCESHFNPNAKNGDYLGMFQFSTSTWKTYRVMLGVDSSPSLRTNIEESIKTAAFMMSKRGIAPWPACL